MSTGETKSALLSAGLRIPVLAVSAICSFTTTRLLIDYGGIDTYAFAALLFSLTVMLPFADFGVGAAVVNVVAESGSPSTDTSVSRVALTAARVLVASAASLVVIAAGVAVLGGWSHVAGTAARGLSHADFAVWLGITCFALGLPLALSQRVLLGTNRNHLYVLTSGLASPLALALAWFAIRAGAPPELTGVALPGGILFALGVSWVAAVRTTRIPLYTIMRRVPRVAAYPGQRIRKTAIPMAIIIAGMPIALQADRIILSHQSTTTQVALYSIAAQLFSPVMAVLSTGGASLWPVFARRRSAGESGLGLLVSGLLLVCLAAAAATCLLWLVGPWMATLLSGGEVTISAGLVLAFGAFAMVNGVQTTVGAALTSESGLRFQSYLVALMVPANLVLSWLLSGSVGAAGPVVASASTIFCILVVPNIIHFRRLDKDQSKFRQREVAEQAA